MNRPIKFRAWHDEFGEMVYSTSETVFGKREFYPFGFAVGFSRYPTEGWNIMQFTGLHDANETEIYEGDILQCTHWFFDGNEVEEAFVATVGFRGGSFTLENIRSRFYADYTGWENGKGVCWIGEIRWMDDDYAVIGNVYEHKHLLPGASDR